MLGEDGSSSGEGNSSAGVSISELKCGSESGASSGSMGRASGESVVGTASWPPISESIQEGMEAG